MSKNLNPALREDVRVYLNDLRDSEIINMDDACPYIQSKFGLERQDAFCQLSLWMNNFAITLHKKRIYEQMEKALFVAQKGP